MSEPSPPADAPRSSEPSAPVAAKPLVSPILDGKVPEHHEGITLGDLGEEEADRRLANIEMVGEEVAAGWKPAPHQPLSPEVRFLHISRTIHQLITDRNRSVGIFLAVASLSFAASTALLNAHADVVTRFPLRTLQYWCFPVTFATLAVIGAFMCLILVRTRIGLIYEVSKMNALLGLPSERVKRVNPFSIFFLMYLMVCLCAGASAGLATGMIVSPPPERSRSTSSSGADVERPVPQGDRGALLVGCAVGAVDLVFFLIVYYWMVLGATTDAKLEKARS